MSRNLPTRRSRPEPLLMQPSMILASSAMAEFMGTLLLQLLAGSTTIPARAAAAYAGLSKPNAQDHLEVSVADNNAVLSASCKPIRGKHDSLGMESLTYVLTQTQHSCTMHAACGMVRHHNDSVSCAADETEAVLKQREWPAWNATPLNALSQQHITVHGSVNYGGAHAVASNRRCQLCPAQWGPSEPRTVPGSSSVRPPDLVHLLRVHRRSGEHHMTWNLMQSPVDSGACY